MSAHTPGPWNAVEVGDTGGENPMPVYEVQTMDGHKRICEYIRPDDARLCAAAPELLEALQSIAECCDEDHAARDYASRQTEIRGIARAAIAKATGE